MAEFGYNRVLNELSWNYESVKLVNFYSKVLADHGKEFSRQQIYTRSDA